MYFWSNQTGLKYNTKIGFCKIKNRKRYGLQFLFYTIPLENRHLLTHHVMVQNQVRHFQDFF